jgi:hypothetical protein
VKEWGEEVTFTKLGFGFSEILVVVGVVAGRGWDLLSCSLIVGVYLMDDVRDCDLRVFPSEVSTYLPWREASRSFGCRIKTLPIRHTL